jgi:hypothetical protein
MERLVRDLAGELGALVSRAALAFRNCDPSLDPPS